MEQLLANLGIGIIIGAIATYAWLKSAPIKSEAGKENELDPTSKIESLHLAHTQFRKELNELKIQKPPKAPDEKSTEILEALKLVRAEQINIRNEISLMDRNIFNDVRAEKDFVREKFQSIQDQIIRLSKANKSTRPAQASSSAKKRARA